MTTKNNFKVRLGKLNDIFQIGEVFSDSIRKLCKNDYEESMITRWIDSKPPKFRSEHIKSHSLWVAEVDGEIAAYLIAIPGEVIALFVASSYSGLGIGAALLTLGIETAQKDESRGVKLESTITAAPFYKKMGFVEVGRGYYTHAQSELELPIINMVLSRMCV